MKAGEQYELTEECLGTKVWKINNVKPSGEGFVVTATSKNLLSSRYITKGWCKENKVKKL